MTGAIPQPVWVPVSSALAEPTWILLSHDLGVVNEGAVANVNAKLSEYDALLIGCGLGQENATRGFMERLLRRNHSRRRSALPGGFAAWESEKAEDGQPVSETDSSSNGEEAADSATDSPFGTIRRRDELPAETLPLPPTVIDADGLNNLAQLDDWPSLLPADCVLTPHPAEMARLCGLASVQEVVDNPLGTGAGAGDGVAGRGAAERTLYGNRNTGRRAGCSAGRHSCAGYGRHRRHFGRRDNRPAGPGLVSFPGRLPWGLAARAGR